MSDDQRLIRIKEEYDVIKIELGIAEKELLNLQNKLKSEYGIDDISLAENYLNEITEELRDLQEKRENRFKVIESKLKAYRS
jgi:hypothetical protein